MIQLSALKQVALLGFVGLVSACAKNEPATNPVPVIAFKSIRKVILAANPTKLKRDSVITTISFSDGDGDLGENI